MACSVQRTESFYVPCNHLHNHFHGRSTDLYQLSDSSLELLDIAFTPFHVCNSILFSFANSIRTSYWFFFVQLSKRLSLHISPFKSLLMSPFMPRLSLQLSSRLSVQFFRVCCTYKEISDNIFTKKSPAYSATIYISDSYFSCSVTRKICICFLDKQQHLVLF